MMEELHQWTREELEMSFYLDFCNAFDMVTLSMLLSKLERDGFEEWTVRGEESGGTVVANDSELTNLNL